MPCLLGRGCLGWILGLQRWSRRLFLIYSRANPQIKANLEVCVGARVVGLVGVCWRKQRAAVTSIFFIQHLKQSSFWCLLLNLLGFGSLLRMSRGDAVGSSGNPPLGTRCSRFGHRHSGSTSTLAQEPSPGSLLGLAAETWHWWGNILCALRINCKIIKL